MGLGWLYLVLLLLAGAPGVKFGQVGTGGGIELAKRPGSEIFSNSWGGPGEHRWAFLPLELSESGERGRW